ncbi:hypothetical protein [Methylobacterium iners]|uniref:DUF2157 domain-containing protein n=1 Tax=Methylobacterium iners TaxID=418707 RepID=A0ABQ4S346_9HYPH|nr:hypothetical protein [Methylobacterium iners]GJD97509.1 hypothetical protein OCOJLMKI_4741 [Methylobacterium iners]
MIDTALLQRAVGDGVITQEQSLALQRLSREADGPPRTDAVQDDEQLRLVTGFADIFVTIGLVLFLGTLAFFGGHAFGLAITAAAAWGLAEFFTRRRRMALPSIVLLIAFTGAGFGAVVLAFAEGISQWADRPAILATGALTAVGLAALHYRRFAVPVTIAAGTAALIGTLVALGLAVAPDAVQAHLNALLIVAGVATFALAMRFDLADPLRLTRRTDIAFWLHLLAAPLIVHPVLARIATTSGGPAGNAQLVLAVVLVLALVALITDRRAILVSGLAYAGIAFGSLMREAGFATNALPLTLLALGAFILLLSAGWHPLRAGLLRALPRTLAARLPHPIGAR